MRKVILYSIMMFLFLAGFHVEEGFCQKKAEKKAEEYNIVQALEKGIIEIEATGAGLEKVEVKVIKKVAIPLRIIIPAGTYFKNRGEAQDMVATKKVTIDLLTQKKSTVNVPAACANFHKDVPRSESRFDVSLTPGSEELGKLMEVIGKKSPSKEVKQVAVWIVTDDVTRRTLDSRYRRIGPFMVFGGPPAASDDDVVEAIRIVEEAGINIAEKAIVKERISLIKGLSSKKRDIVEYSAKLLGYKGEKNLDIWKIETLISALKDEDSEVREAAAEALGKLKDPRAVEPLISALKDENSYVRKGAAEALGKLKDPRAVEPLISALKDKHSDVPEAAAKALGELKDPRAVEPLISALKDEGWDVREEAAKALGELKDPRAVEPLISALKDEKWFVRKEAAKALEKITGRYFGENHEKWNSWWQKNKRKFVR